jgi:ABC-type multidrug transport system fused ATPase/permease subunit
MTRFASQTVRDLRRSALRAVRGRSSTKNPADVIARVVGDSARLKTNLTGFCVHFSLNAMLMVGITALFLYLAPKLGLLLLLTGLMALALGYVAVGEVTKSSLKLGKSEARYARKVHLQALADGKGANDGRINRRSTKKEVRGARLLGRTTLGIHLAVRADAASPRRAGWTPGGALGEDRRAHTTHRRTAR